MYSIMSAMHDSSLTQAKADAIPRYREPDGTEELEPTEGRCYNCEHTVAITLGGKAYKLCAQERDDQRRFGEVYECDPDETECADWSWDGFGL